MGDLCKWLHEQLQQLPPPIKLGQKFLPKNGIYFFYEEGETWGHGGDEPRIVKIGKATGFKARIGKHYGTSEAILNLDKSKGKLSDTSVLRKHIGKAFLKLEGRSDYLEIWHKDFSIPANRAKLGYQRDIILEKEIESKITERLWGRFTFRFIIIDSQEKRKILEKPLIATITQCRMCRFSYNWLGKHHPDANIQQYHSWLLQDAENSPINDADKDEISEAIKNTQKWIKDNW